MKPRFISVRADGLGSRLRTLLNAIALAHECNGDFEFAWPSNPNTASGDLIRPVEEIFSQGFIKRHYCPGWLELFDFSRGDGPKREQFGTHLLSRDKIREIFRNRDTTSACHIAPIYVDLSKEFDLEGKGIYEKAFRELDFTPSIKRSLDIAWNMSLSKNTTAFHLRAGDIVEGGYRYSGAYTEWVLPFPLATELVEREINSGRNAIIFGQDKTVIEHICKSTEATSAAELSISHNISGVESWFFEIALMSRCARIVSGGESSFSKFAAWIGDCEAINGYDIFESSTAMKLIDSQKTDAAPVSSLQKSFAYWSVYAIFGKDIKPDHTAGCLRKAISHDPENHLYKLAYVDILSRLGEFESAENFLGEMMSHEAKDMNWSRGCLRETLHNLRLNSYTALATNILLGIEKLFLQRKSANAAICLALTSDDPDLVTQMIDFVKSRDRTHYQFFSHALKRRLEDTKKKYK